MFGVLFSALGATAPGLINLSVAERTLTRGVRPGMMVATGAALTQLIYTFIAVYFIDVIIKNEIITESINWAACVIFLGLGVFYFFKTAATVKPSKSASDRKHFGYGLVIAGMNMLIIPTWIFIAIWLKSNGFDFIAIREIIFISLGSGIGALLVFVGYVRLSRYILDQKSN
ncbi:MAG: LysE family transporter, partial [Saprospiraceae bacterium]|nr:LysE family transporter [Saprospiraceae bacterium]